MCIDYFVSGPPVDRDMTSVPDPYARGLAELKAAHARTETTAFEEKYRLDRQRELDATRRYLDAHPPALPRMTAAQKRFAPDPYREGLERLRSTGKW
jgi:hypothetical protein